MDNTMEAADLTLGPSLSGLEQRVQRLEQTVAGLQNTQVLEDRIVDRLARREAPREAATPLSAQMVYSTVASAVVTPPWILFELFSDIKCMILMFFDMRFHVAWLTRVATILLLTAILTTDWWFPLAYVPFLGWLAVRVVDLFLAFLLFKFLCRDAARYREFRGRR